MFDVYEIRKQFPVLAREINGKPNTFLDTGASAQKPRCVIDKMLQVYSHDYANVHRGSYLLSEEITEEYEKARKTVQKFINAKSDKEIVFTRNATEGINLVAAAWGRKFLQKGDEVLISEAEHHANLIPWQQVRDETGCTLKIFKIADDGSFVWDEYVQLLSEKTKLVAVTAMSNVLGTIFPIKKMAQAAHNVGALFLTDACQFAVHHQIDVQDMDCDFLAFSGHKLMGPTGVGVLYGKKKLLDDIEPVDFGGDMAEDVYTDHMSYKDAPYKFEAGTPMIAEVIALKEAIKFISSIGLDNIYEHELKLKNLAIEKLSEIPNIEIYNKDTSTGVISFNIKGCHPHDAASVYDKNNICIRAGHHCAELIMHHLQVVGTVRASFYLYNDENDVYEFVKATKEAVEFFSMFDL